MTARSPPTHHRLIAVEARMRRARERGGREEGERRERGGRKEGERRERGGRKEGEEGGGLKKVE